MVEKVLRMAKLLDSYGPLLTEKQRDLMRLYYEEDFSLGEIAAEYQVSRQAVYDILRRAEALLEEWEKRISLVREQAQRAAHLKQALRLLEKLEDKVVDQQGLDLLAQIKTSLRRLGDD